MASSFNVESYFFKKYYDIFYVLDWNKILPFETVRKMRNNFSEHRVKGVRILEKENMFISMTKIMEDTKSL